MKEIIAFFVACGGLPLFGVAAYYIVKGRFKRLPDIPTSWDTGLGIAGIVVLVCGTVLALAVLADAWTGFQFRITG